MFTRSVIIHNIQNTSFTENIYENKNININRIVVALILSANICTRHKRKEPPRRRRRETTT